MLKSAEQDSFKDIVKRTERYAIEQSVWGVNFQTAYLTTFLIHENLHLLNQGSFGEYAKGIDIHSAFGTLDELFKWLRSVSDLFASAADGKLTFLPEDKKHLNIKELKDVNLYQFVKQTNGYDMDISVYIKSTMRLMGSITEALKVMKSSLDSYFTLRLLNGLTTMLVFNEQVIGVMMNEQ